MAILDFLKERAGLDKYRGGVKMALTAQVGTGTPRVDDLTQKLELVRYGDNWDIYSF